MAYQSLYRVFRPRTFGGVVGQGHITDILKKQVAGGKPSHAYLFYGPRGTGKTSTAKILANALNCLDPRDGEPCGECEVCRSLAEDSFVDVVEIDAASNNGVDNVRDIREKVSLLPAQGKYKVYIIDEVHMLSSGAFNALLKTLEEPPPHAVFILATTEQRKVPPTILSRCQKYDFRRITEEDIVSRLAYVAREEGAEYEPEALEMIAKQAEGALRDALSIMDQCIAANGALTLAAVLETVGAAPGEALAALADDILSENPAGAVSALNGLLAEGVSAHNLLRDMITTLSERLAGQACSNYDRANILRSLEALIAVQADLRYSGAPGAVLLAATVRAAVNTADVDHKDLELRMARLEKRVEKLAAGPPRPVEAGRAGSMAGPGPAPKQEKEDRPPWEEPAGPAEKPTGPTAAREPELPAGEAGPPASPKEAELAAKLSEFQASMMRRNMALYPSAGAIEGIEIQGSRLVVRAKREDAPLMEMLGDSANRADMDAVTAEVFGREMTPDFVYDAAGEADDVQMELIALFGEENVDIVE
jgi:DNA polymerase-3 subunit gamma/tau